MGLDHAFHSDVIMTLVYSNNLRLNMEVLFDLKTNSFVTDRKHLKVCKLLFINVHSRCVPLLTSSYFFERGAFYFGMS